MSDWKENFVAVCEEMRTKGETERDLTERGKVILRPEEECKKCHSAGIYRGLDLEYGAFYECAIVDYCPACKSVNGHGGVNFAPYGQEEFLPIMRRKIVANPGLALAMKGERSCPVCGGSTATFEKDLGGIDFYDNTWTVCVNPDCNWPGSHIERYEQGPY